MNNEAGYIVMCAPKRKNIAEYFTPLAYGSKPEHHAMDMLLAQRGATLFATETQAWDALKDTLTEAEADGCAWPKANEYFVIEVRHAPQLKE